MTTTSLKSEKMPDVVQKFLGILLLICMAVLGFGLGWGVPHAISLMSEPVVIRTQNTINFTSMQNIRINTSTTSSTSISTSTTSTTTTLAAWSNHTYYKTINGHIYRIALNQFLNFSCKNPFLLYINGNVSCSPVSRIQCTQEIREVYLTTARSNIITNRSIIFTIENLTQGISYC